MGVVCVRIQIRARVVYEFAWRIMSWDQYLDNLVAQSRDSTGVTHVDRGCIIGIDGGGRWTSDSHRYAMKVCDWNIHCMYYVHEYCIIIYVCMNYVTGFPVIPT